MQELRLEPLNSGRPRSSLTIRDWVALGFRHGRLMVLSFLAIFLSVAVITWLTPARYEAEMKILVKRERVDPVVSPEANTQFATTADLNEQDLNSEVELLKSRDLLEKVVVASGLDARPARSFLGTLMTVLEGGTQGRVSGRDLQMFQAVRNLERNLSVEPLKKTKLIVVSYKSPDPQLSAKVLQTLVRLYLEKHVEVHRVPGALDFFQNQTEQYRKGLVDAEQRLAGFGRKEGVVAAQMAKEITVRKLNDFEVTLQQTHAAIAETEQRIGALEEQGASTPARLTTQMRSSANPYVLQQLKSTLLNLELKRSELLSKFTSDYRPVQEVETQIAQAREALAREENDPVREETTDRDTTHEWLVGELAKARAELTALRARETATSQIVTTYRAQAGQLSQTEITQQDLIRSAKTAEENFLLYTRKQEEARIRDALDRQRIVNVSAAEEATVPALPSSPNRAMNLILGALLACLASVGLACTVDYLDSSFRTPREVEIFLNTPVLAALPKN